jgi:hypothetical protein
VTAPVVPESWAGNGQLAFTITSWRTPTGHPGDAVTVTSDHLDAAGALTWILDDLPINAALVANDAAGQITTIVVDWARVPGTGQHHRQAGR